MASEDERSSGDGPPAADVENSEKRDSALSQSRRRRGSRRRFYAAGFEDEEIDDLESASKIDDLDGEIELLKVLIRRKWAQARNQDVYGEVIRRYVDTLCRIVRIRHSVSGKGSDNLPEVLDTVLTEVGAEIGMPLTPEAAAAQAKMKGEISNGPQQSSGRSCTTEQG